VNTTATVTARQRSPAAEPMRAAAWAVLAILPFWSLYLAHSLIGPNRPTGFIAPDMPYYVANGREIFERGNGLMYCNPYDPDPAAPVIYFHWLPWIFGYGTKVIGLDPGLVFVAVGAIAGLTCAFLTYRMVEEILPDPRCRVACYLLTMWGGGVLVLLAVLANLVSGVPVWHDMLRFDPFEGWWFLNWGRNLVMPQEAVYHALVAGAWLAVVRGRDWPAVLAVAALALTHPFSGIQHLLVLGAWLCLRAVGTPGARLPLVFLSLVTAAFLSYYFLYLPSFPQHRAVHGTWSLDWSLPLSGLVYGYLPVGALAAARCWRDRGAWRPEMTFFLVAAAASLLLVKHELFLPARQPLHFTRGYVWLPLALLALPLVQSMLLWSISKPIRTWRMAIAAGLLGLSVLDDATFLAIFWMQPNQRHADVRVDPAIADAFRFLDRSAEKGIVLVNKPDPADWEDYNYLAATYTGLTPLVGHPWLTPNHETMLAAAVTWDATRQRSEIIDRVNVMILPIGFPLATLPGGAAAWRITYANARVIVIQRAKDT